MSDAVACAELWRDTFAAEFGGSVEHLSDDAYSQKLHYCLESVADQWDDLEPLALRLQDQSGGTLAGCEDFVSMSGAEVLPFHEWFDLTFEALRQQLTY